MFRQNFIMFKISDKISDKISEFQTKRQNLKFLTKNLDKFFRQIFQIFIPILLPTNKISVLGQSLTQYDYFDTKIRRTGWKMKTWTCDKMSQYLVCITTNIEMETFWSQGYYTMVGAIWYKLLQKLCFIYISHYTTTTTRNLVNIITFAAAFLTEKIER